MRGRIDTPGPSDPVGARRARRPERSISTLQIGKAADPAEHEADAFAAGLMNDLGARPTQIHRVAVDATDRLGGTMAEPAIATRIRSASGGRPLPAEIRRSAEQRSGRDLSGVRVHEDATAADLSRSLDARAFAVGSKIFLGAGSRGVDVLAHELGHVVQQGGGTVGRIRRSTHARPLAALSPTGHTKINRLLGLGGKSKNKVGGVDTSTVSSDVRKNNAALVAERAKLRKDIQAVEKALTKLEAGARSNGKKNAKIDQSQAADMAASIQASALRLQAGMSSEAQHGKGSAKLGIFHDEVARMQQIVGTTQRIIDVHTRDVHDRALVKRSKERGAAKYFEAGQQSVGASNATGAKHFKHLQSKVQFGNEADLDPASAHDQRVMKSRRAGEALGLSAGEIAAIQTFTKNDYSYMTPATANDDAWMKKAFADADDRGLSERKDEGSAHAAVAIQGLMKLPVYQGRVYRGRAMDVPEINSKYPRIDKRTKQPAPVTPSLEQFLLRPEMTKMAGQTFHRVNEKVFTIGSMSSSSKSQAQGERYAKNASINQMAVLYDMQVTNGRDIEELSIENVAGQTSEQEVALLPGATFEVTEVSWDVKSNVLRVVCRQIR